MELSAERLALPVLQGKPAKDKQGPRFYGVKARRPLLNDGDQPTGHILVPDSRAGSSSTDEAGSDT